MGTTPSRAIRDAVQAAGAGERVGVFAGTQKQAQELFNQALQYLEQNGVLASYRRTNGQQQIDLTYPALPGSLLFFSTGSFGVRGTVLDRAYIPRGTSEEKIENIVPAMYTTPDGGLLITYVPRR